MTWRTRVSTIMIHRGRVKRRRCMGPESHQHTLMIRMEVTTMYWWTISKWTWCRKERWSLSCTCARKRATMTKSKSTWAIARKTTLMTIRIKQASITVRSPWLVRKLAVQCRWKDSTWFCSCSRHRLNRMRTVKRRLRTMTLSCQTSPIFWRKSSFNLWPHLMQIIKRPSNKCISMMKGRR